MPVLQAPIYHSEENDSTWFLLSDITNLHLIYQFIQINSKQSTL